MKKITVRALAFVCVIGLLMTGCAKKPPVKGAVAKVKDEYIMQADVDKILDSYRQIYGAENFDEKTEQGKNTLLKMKPMIIDSLIYQRMSKYLAEELKITVSDDEVKKQAETYKGQIGAENFEKMLKEQGKTQEDFLKDLKENLISSELNKKLSEMNKATEEEVNEAIKKDAKKYVQYNADHILISTRDKDQKELTGDALKEKEEKANKIYEELTSGKKDFAEVAKAESEDKGSAEKGGALGDFIGVYMVPEFNKALEGMKVGEISKPIKTEYGYHIIKLNAKETDFSKFTKENQDMLKDQYQKELTTEKTKKYLAEREKDFGVERY